jgi:hypothetical protein
MKITLKTIKHKFVEFIPPDLEFGVIYITMIYKSAQHLCVCGCGERVVTPLTPKHWSILFDGASISLDPSIGNWNFPCQSHYWIIKSNIVKAQRWSDYKIKSNRDEEGAGEEY